MQLIEELDDEDMPYEDEDMPYEDEAVEESIFENIENDEYEEINLKKNSKKTKATKKEKAAKPKAKVAAAKKETKSKKAGILKNIIKLNGLENKITPYLGRCEQLITKINFNKIVGGVAEVSVFIDPPRIGCVKTVLDKILELKPNKIIYLSCNPETLARDLSVLVEYNYKLNSVTPFDMFPQTNHIETLAVLTKI